ncbi:MAG: hypothetical protein V3T70_11865, partial [Phycisphaerae bacterium]
MLNGDRGGVRKGQVDNPLVVLGTFGFHAIVSTRDVAVDEEICVAERFCAMLPSSPTLVRRNKPPLPDFTIELGGEHILLELTRYREQGPHNNAHERDEQFKQRVLEAWLNDPIVNQLALSVEYR